jgi:Domain of unknown function (DUF305)
MRTWLRQWGRSERTRTDQDETAMPGMLPEDVMVDLMGRTEVESDLAFADLLRRHHRGAIRLAQTELREGSLPEVQELLGGWLTPSSVRLASSSSGARSGRRCPSADRRAGAGARPSAWGGTARTILRGQVLGRNLTRLRLSLTTASGLPGHRPEGRGPGRLHAVGRWQLRNPERTDLRLKWNIGMALCLDWTIYVRARHMG